MSDIIAVAHTLAQTLERLGVVYWIGGSMASAIHGVPRSTQDVDFVAELKEEQVDDLVAALESEFYIDGAAVRRAVRSRRSFNVIHLDTMYKADVFDALGGCPRHKGPARQSFSGRGHPMIFGKKNQTSSFITTSINSFILARL